MHIKTAVPIVIVQKKSGCDVSSIRIIDDIPEKLYEKRHVYFID